MQRPVTPSRRLTEPPPAGLLGRIRGELRSTWPTLPADVIANVPSLAIGSAVILNFEAGFKVREWKLGVWTWQRVDYLSTAWKDRLHACAFALWSVEMVIMLGVLVYHVLVRHHPKYYVSRCSRLAIVAHIIGGTVGIFGSYIGFVIGSQPVVAAGVAAAALLHFPSALWQARALHGTREVMQPAYYFFIFMLLIKYLDLLVPGPSAAAVMSMGIALNTFSLVRFYYHVMRFSGMEMIANYDRSVLFAAGTNVPFWLGPMGIAMLVLTVVLWNAYIHLLHPEVRPLLWQNRSYHDVFPEVFRGRAVRFREELARCKREYADPREAVARCVFTLIAGEDELIEEEELRDLFTAWGVPEARMAATRFFANSHDKFMDFKQFETELWFIWEHVYTAGEAEGAHGDVVEVHDVEAAGARLIGG